MQLIEHRALLAAKQTLGERLLGVVLNAVTPGEVESLERQVISATLEQNEWNKSQTARLLGVSRPTLDQKIERYRIVRVEEKGEES